MDKIKENESENITVKSIVISVNYMVGFSSVEMPKEVYEELKRMLQNKNKETLPEPEELAFESENSRKITSRWLSEHIHEGGAFQREYEVEYIMNNI